MRTALDESSSKLLLASMIPTMTALFGIVVNYRKVRQIERRIIERIGSRPLEGRTPPGLLSR
jgi:hypothetical protein